MPSVCAPLARRPITFDNVFIQPIFGIVPVTSQSINSDLTNEMNRRTKDRIDLRLLCRIGPEKVLSSASANQSQVVGMTQNLSRCGLLMRWMDSVDLPEAGSALTVDIDLPADEAFGPRLMRCGTTVVRILPSADGGFTVGMKIRNIRFVAPKRISARKSEQDAKVTKVTKRVMQTKAGADGSTWALESMPLASQRLN
jgi:hypothetical protein